MHRQPLNDPYVDVGLQSLNLQVILKNVFRLQMWILLIRIQASLVTLLA